MGKGGGNVHPRGAGAAGTASGDGALRRPRSSPDGAANLLMRRVFHPTGTVGLGLVGTEASGGGGGGGRDDTSTDGADTGRQPNVSVASSNSLIDSNGERSQDEPGTAAASSRNFPQHRGRKRSRSSFDGHDDDDDDNDVIPDAPSVAPAEDSEAFGYVMLDDCSVLIGTTDDDISDCGTVLTGQWTDVTVLHQEKEDERMVVEEEDRVSAQHPSFCHRCDLVLNRNVGGEDDNASPSCGWLMMDSSSIVRFDGTIRDAKCVPQSLPSDKNTDDGDDENSSDAALLMGLILNCQDLGLVKITKCSIALHGRDGPKEQHGRNSTDGSAPNQNDAGQYRASIVVTLSVDLVANRSFATSSTSHAKPPAKKRARRSSYDFERLCSDVELVFRNAMLYNPPDHHVHKAAKRLSDKFKELVATFKSIQTKNAKKAYGSISSKPDSSVAAILAERVNDEIIDSLCPSSGNLLIVPNTLLTHWENQISMHVDFTYLTKKIPLVFRLRKKGKASHTKEEVMRLCNTEKTHFPLLLIDEGTNSPLPPPSFLAMFHVVLTTNQRIQSEWKFGSVEEELKISRGGRQASYRAFYDDIITDTPPPSPLLKVNWLRLVVDEGASVDSTIMTHTHIYIYICLCAYDVYQSFEMCLELLQHSDLLFVYLLLSLRCIF